MINRIIGQVKRVNGPVIEVMGITDAQMFELVRVGEENLIGELIKLEKNSAVIQVYEDTTGIAPFDPVYGGGMELSVELGPGMVGTIYDGIQRPLEAIRDISDMYIKRGISVPSLSREKKWHFVPSLKQGNRISGGDILGVVQETENVLHKILVSPDDKGILESIVPEGDHTVEGNSNTKPMTHKQKISSMQMAHHVQRPTKGVSPRYPLITTAGH
jgi:V/A-type H+-transporting ATPase subunit A